MSQRFPRERSVIRFSRSSGSSRNTFLTKKHEIPNNLWMWLYWRKMEKLWLTLPTPDRRLDRKKTSLHENSFFPSDALVRRGLRPLTSASSHPALWSLHVTLKPPYPSWHITPTQIFSAHILIFFVLWPFDHSILFFLNTLQLCQVLSKYIWHSFWSILKATVCLNLGFVCDLAPSTVFEAPLS